MKIYYSDDSGLVTIISIRDFHGENIIGTHTQVIIKIQKTSVHMLHHTNIYLYVPSCAGKRNVIQAIVVV